MAFYDALTRHLKSTEFLRDAGYVNGNWIGGNGAATFDVFNPATGEKLATLPEMGASETAAAIDAAHKVQAAWAARPAKDRSILLRKWNDLIVANADELAAILTAEMGKPLPEARGEILYAASYVEWYAEEAKRINGETIPAPSVDKRMLVIKQPVGVVGTITPWNFPAAMIARKVAPALISGNTVVVRPSNNTPTSAFEIARAAAEAELPAGVFNVLTMVHEVAATLCQHPAVGMITLTGSVGAGRTVLDYCKANIAKPSLELGGKTPAIIEADADLEQAASAIAASKTTHCGQLCTAIERVYVQASVHDRFLALLRDKLAAVRSGNRGEDPSRMGPLVNERSRQEIHAKVQRALAEGARLECGGVLPEGPGHFYPATLLSNCRQDMEIVQEEIFGPVLPVLRYETLDEALAMANDHQFGLSSVLYSENYRTAMKVANAIEAGELYVNRTPADPYQGFHAGWKRSGLGGDDGKHGMLEFTQTRLVVLKY